MSLSLGHGVRITEHARLDARNTFGVHATAPLLVEVTDAAALPELFGYAMLRDPATLILGGGSNMLFAGNPEAAVLALDTRRIEMLHGNGSHISESLAFQGRAPEGLAPEGLASESFALVRADAGVVWHEFVLWTLGHGLCGLENLALIPGTVGAAPIQNIGAYGVEVRDCIHAVEAFDRQLRSTVRLDAAQCAFGYRDSLFKQDPNRYLVMAVEFLLPHHFVPKLGYAGIGEELRAMGMAEAPRASQVAEAVIRIRQRKLPDPAVLGNAGSFFKNPIVPAAQAEALHASHPRLPVFATGDAHLRKLSAAWLIDQSGFKGYREGDAGVSDEHALVLVNHGAATGLQLLALARRIAEAVHTRFGVAIEPEPRIIGAAW